MKSSLIAKVSLDAAVLCLRKQGQPSPVFFFLCVRVMSREEISSPAKR